MKKKILIVLLIFSTCFVGCNKDTSNKKEENDYSNYSVYEIHRYDETFEHTEEMIATYDKNGNLKKLEAYMVYDKITDPSKCDSFNHNLKNDTDYNYPEVEAKCSVDENGGKIYYSMTDKSIKAGYLQNEEEIYSAPFEQIYENFETEENVKEFIEEGITYFKEHNIECDDKNYIVINGVRKEW